MRLIKVLSVWWAFIGGTTMKIGAVRVVMTDGRLNILGRIKRRREVKAMCVGYKPAGDLGQILSKRGHENGHLWENEA